MIQRQNTFSATALLLLVWVLSPSGDLVGDEAPAFNSPVLESRTWVGETFPEPVELRLYANEEAAGNGPRSGILYLLNHGGNRVGTEPNESILNDFIGDGYAVVIADFGSHPGAVPPEIDREILAIYNAFRNGELFEPMPFKVDAQWTYVVPEGFRLRRNLTYWEIDRHGAHGTVEHIMRAYNRRSGHSRASRMEEMSKPDGDPIDYTLQMDVIYPSRPKESVPVVMFQSSSSPRNGWQGRRSHHIGFMLRGYAFVHYDHNYNPIARSDHFGFFHPYSLDSYNGVASNTAAVRCVRAHAGEWGLDVNSIGVWGHSKASYGAALLGNPRNSELNEWRTFEGFPAGSPEPQPWLEYSSEVTVVYQSAGDGTQRHRSLIDRDYAPTLTSSGDRDSLMAAEYWEEHFRHLEKLDIPHLAMRMVGEGHNSPEGYDTDLDIDRYEVCFDFFEAHLRERSDRPPRLLYALPLDGAENVSSPKPVELRFATAMDAHSITGSDVGVVIADYKGKKVAGNWEVAQRNTLFRWIPDEALVPGAVYTLQISSTVATETGIPSGTERSHRFTAGIPVENDLRSIDEYRREHDLLYGIEDARRPPFGEWPAVGKTVDSLPAFSISPYSSLRYTAGYRLVEDNRSDGSGRYYLRWTSGGEADVKIDFGEPRTVSQLVVRNGSEDGREQLTGLRLRYSNDGPEQMETLLEVEDNADSQLNLVFSPVTARWFQIDSIPLDEPVRIADLEMYEQPREIATALNLFTADRSDPLLKGGEVVLRAMASDRSIERVEFRANGELLDAPVTRKGNGFSTILPEPEVGELHIEARGWTDNGGIVEAEPLLVNVVQPQLDLSGAFPPDHALIDGDWETLEDGSLLSPLNGMLLSGAGIWEDYVVEMDVEVKRLGGRFRLIFRADDSRNHDRFDFLRSRSEMRFVKNGDAQRIRRNFYVTAREGKRHTLRMEVFGKRARLLVDGVETVDFYPLDRDRGGIGLQTVDSRLHIHGLKAYFPDLPGDAPAPETTTEILFPAEGEIGEERSTEVFADSVGWYSSAPDDLIVATNKVRQKISATSFIVAYLTESGNPVELQPGQTLAVAYRFSVEGISSTSRSPWYRMGVFDSSTGAGRIRGDGFGISQVEFSGYTGYMLDTGNLRAGTVSLHRRSGVSVNNLMSARRAYTRLGDSFSGWSGLRDGAIYEGQLRIRRNVDDSIALTATLSAEDGRVIYEKQAQSIDSSVKAFDTFAFMVAGSSVDAFTIYKVRVDLLESEN